MKKQIEKKLRLSKETLRNLSERELLDAVGGATTTCSGTTSSCTNSECPTCDACGPTRFSC
jgi:hypothetical protein